MRTLIVDRKHKGRVFTVTLTGSGQAVLASLSAAIQALAGEHRLKVFNADDPFGGAAPKKKRKPRASAPPIRLDEVLPIVPRETTEAVGGGL
jgi:predicted NAD/FAD-binding protein